MQQKEYPDHPRDRYPEEYIDWRGCPDVESVPGKRSGELVLNGTRVPPATVLANAREFTGDEQDLLAEGIAKRFPTVTPDAAQHIIDFALKQQGRKNAPYPS